MKLGDVLIAAVIGVSAIFLVLSHVNQNTPVNVVHEAKMCDLVHTILEHTMEGMDADRAYLFQFHNGTHGLSEKQFMFYSNTHEVCRPGVSPEILNLQRLPLSMLSASWFPELEKKSWFQRLTKDEPHTQTKLILEKQGIRAVAIARILYSGNLIGFIGVDYVRETPAKIDSAQLTEAANMIQAILIRK